VACFSLAEIGIALFQRWGLNYTKCGERGRKRGEGERENIDQSTLLTEFVFDFACIAPFITAVDSKRMETENLCQIPDFSSSA